MFMPLKGGCIHLATQGVALGYVLVAPSGRLTADTMDNQKKLP